MRNSMVIGVFMMATPVCGQAVAQMSQAPAAVPQATAKKPPQFNSDTPIVELLDDPRAKEILQRLIPGLATHPSYEQFKHMSLREVAPYSDGQITNEMIAKVDAELKKLN